MAFEMDDKVVIRPMKNSMSGSPQAKSFSAAPLPGKAIELKVGDGEADDIEPGLEALQEARRRLLAEYGPCAAGHTDLLMATARRIENDRSKTR